MEDPIASLKAAGYTNLIESYGGVNAYSFVCKRQTGYLDYTLGKTFTLASLNHGHAGIHVLDDLQRGIHAGCRGWGGSPIGFCLWYSSPFLLVKLSSA